MAKYNRKWGTIPQGHIKKIVSMMEQNIIHQEIKVSDLRNWIRAYRFISNYDPPIAIERMLDWHAIMNNQIEPVFYLYSLYFIEWMNSQKAVKGFSIECLKWIKKCQDSRFFGQSSWSYEWLAKDSKGYKIVHYYDLGYDPVDLIKRGSNKEEFKKFGITRIEGVLTEYLGPQKAFIDIGQNLKVWFAPLDIIAIDHLGKSISIYLSFSYNGLRGWDPVIAG